VCIYGAGAIGGVIGASLAAQGHAVAAVARGETLASLQREGWRVQRPDGTLLQAPVQAVADSRALGPQDLVVVAVKGPAMPAVASGMSPLLDDRTVVLPAINGVPWWFCAGEAGQASGLALRSVDPDGATARAIPLAQVLGCVVHLAAAASAPGQVQWRSGRGLIVGEPAGGPSPRLQALAATLTDAGFEVTCSGDVRRDIWYKLWGNLTMNPLSALTGATVDRLLDDPLTRAFCSAAMAEAAAIGERIGCAVAQTPEERHAVTRRLGAFKTSMLQDAEAGRPLELDAIVGAAREIGAHLGLPSPHIDALFGMTRVFGQVRGLYPG
jgi:2-dehydropantoate 2-reductase